MVKLDNPPSAPSPDSQLRDSHEGLAGGSERPHISGSVEQLLDLRRIGVVMSPDRERFEEAWGVLNPASARSHDGELYLFPRAVAEGNFSRIAIARVEFDASGDPCGVERMGLVLEPHEDYELAGNGVGGVEDPRITYLPLLDRYIMTYTALGPRGARIALAVSEDLHTWERLGLVNFEPGNGVDINHCDNKDCVIFPLPVMDPAGHEAFAILHRPILPPPTSDDGEQRAVPPDAASRHPSIWISYAPLDHVKRDVRGLTQVFNHQLLAHPMGAWEYHHIGSGAPPILSEEGWLLYYHGVLGAASTGMTYQTGVMLLDRYDPHRVIYRSARPVLGPQLSSEREGIVPNVVFPTAVDVRGQRIDVYYGAADERIAAATTRIEASVLLAPSAPPTAHSTRRVMVPTGEIRVE
jgi:beta-1,2-mannobiose phosphorylase / 1,2-beta-oligomannan phosphorylase